jgi:hypothetical protein
MKTKRENPITREKFAYNSAYRKPYSARNNNSPVTGLNRFDNRFEKDMDDFANE